MDENKEIAERLTYQTRLMEVLSEDQYRIGAYKNAANILKKLETPVSELLADETLGDIDGIGHSIVDAVQSIHTTGTTPRILELEAKIPKGVIEMLGISGLGPRKVAVIWKDSSVSPGCS